MLHFKVFLSFFVAVVLEGCGQVHNATEDECSVSVKVSFIRRQKNVHHDDEQNKIVYFETQTWECIKQHSLKVPTKRLIGCYLFWHVIYFLLKQAADNSTEYILSIELNSDSFNPLTFHKILI